MPYRRDMRSCWSRMPFDGRSTKDACGEVVSRCRQRARVELSAIMKMLEFEVVASARMISTSEDRASNDPRTTQERRDERQNDSQKNKIKNVLCTEYSVLCTTFSANRCSRVWDAHITGAH